MPWTAKDAKRFKKGLTSAQAKSWASIANGVLRSCQAKGGKDCEGKAIRIANSKFNEKEIEKMARELPNGALRFVDEGHGCTAHVEEFADGDQSRNKLKMVAYSGGIIKNHWYWGDLAIDLSGMQFDQAKYPILAEHDTDKKIGFSTKPIINDKGQLVMPENATFVDTEASREFQKLSKEGFPYQSSISARPLSVERLEEGAKAEVNGITLKGPGSIWRKSVFREASVALFGWDRQTSASAFSREPIELEFSETVITAPPERDYKPRKQGKEVNMSMNLEELKEQHPELVVQIEEAATAAATAAFTEEKKDLESKLAEAQAANVDQGKKLLELEKREALRTEKELLAEANAVWLDKLSKSSIPDRMFDKVMPQVKHDGFVKDSVLDVAAFSQAIEAEIKDWEEKLPVDTVQGSGFSEKSIASGENAKGEENLAEENKSIGDRLLSLTGQGKKE
ncbi:hypothetical protein E2P64_06890 [Candidatus Bathyarchaeota archaeon]|nr:hypothetical protein E2P64_06890 [Candidatus Bathyarchaeota archaeon]